MKIHSSEKVWYHISSKWNSNKIRVTPRNGRLEKNDKDKGKPFIAVCDSIIGCFIAIGAWQDYDNLTLYKTLGNPKKADWVDDFKYTNEHRFYEEKVFIKVGQTTTSELLDNGVSDLDMVSLKSFDKNVKTILREKSLILKSFKS